MRVVIENGNYFTKNNLWMMLAEIEAAYIDKVLANYLRILIEELNVKE